jgi:DNA (cytosine-5)-methyltransferase 1
MEWENRFHCEWNEFGKRVLKYYWPEADSHDDITKTDFTKYYGSIDILSGGFPCQPYSAAGKRQGKNDDRHLWPEMLRAIKEIAPRYVVGENVRGLTNWNGGLVFDEVCTDLENLGYQVAPFLIPASAVNAPHKRERIWFVAYSDKRSERPSRTSGRIESNGSNGHIFTQQRRESSELDNRLYEFSRNATDTSIRGMERYRRESERKQLQATKLNEDNSKQFRRMDWEKFPTQSPICSGDDGLPNQLDGITFSKWRNESIKGYGNAVVPQVVLQIFKAIEQYETTERNTSNSNS